MDDTINLMQEIEQYKISDAFECDPEDCRKYLNAPHKQLKLITQNIRSINHNLPGFYTLLARIDTDVDIIVFTECWLNSPTNFTLPEIGNFRRFSSKNNILQNDGVVIYEKSDLKSSTYEYIMKEANCVVTTVNESIAVVSIYRSPSYNQLDPFLESLDQVLISLQSYKNIILTGDINIDIKQTTNDNNSLRYLELIALHGLLPAHQFPTRLNSCLDHVNILTNLSSTTLVVKNSLTDHDTILFALNTKMHKILNKQTKTSINYEKISIDLQNFDFRPVLESSDVNVATSLLVNSISDIMNANTTCKTISRRKSTIKPWITQGLLRCISHRDRMHLKLKKDPENSILKLTYTRYRNYCNNITKNLKNQYHKTELEKAGKTNI